MLDTVNPAMGMMLCSSMPAFEKVYYILLEMALLSEVLQNDGFESF